MITFFRWLERGIEELKNSKNWVLPALKQIRDICCLYQESPPNVSAPGPHGGGQRTPGVLYRHEVINKLQTSHALVILVADNLTNYIDEVRQSPNKILESEPLDYHPDGRYNHVQQVSSI
jgi:ubiquitin carboxyl-terminal hydrolase 9/24